MANFCIFQLLLQAMSTGVITLGTYIIHRLYLSAPCASYEYKCENDRCIHNSQKCKGYNPCGDNSDCKTGITAGLYFRSFLLYG